MAVGRTALIFGHGDTTRLCVERLRAVGADRRFGRRTISVDQLFPIWAIAGAKFGEQIPASEVAFLVMDVAATHFSESVQRARRITASQLKDYPGLSSDSVEERVVAFNRLALEVLQQSTPLQSESVGPALAAAAFLVGRSTSHVFLLKRLARVAPTAFVWFGVMAALAGPRAWDGAWLRAVKGAERLLRPSFSWLDTPVADIGWAEFSWLAATFQDSEQLATLPKMLPRTLGIEIVPGALLQVRVGGGVAEPENRPTSEESARERELQEALNQFLALAQRVRPLLDRAPMSSGQRSLGLEGEPNSYSTKTARPRRKRDTGDA